ncbi:MAG: hypothetical protein ABL889_19735 [Terricaulis sp.]
MARAAIASEMPKGAFIAATRWATMSERFGTLSQLFAEARTAAMHPRRVRRHLTCAICGQMFDRTDAAQAAHHLAESHLKWKPEPHE